MSEEPNDPTLIILSHGRGRPRAKEPSSSLTIWVPVSLHDKLVRLANRHERSVSGLVRDFLTRKISK